MRSDIRPGQRIEVYEDDSSNAGLREDATVTVRDRDSMRQDRVGEAQLLAYLTERLRER